MTFTEKRVTDQKFPFSSCFYVVLAKPQELGTTARLLVTTVLLRCLFYSSNYSVSMPLPCHSAHYHYLSLYFLYALFMLLLPASPCLHTVSIILTIPASQNFLFKLIRYDIISPLEINLLSNQGILATCQSIVSHRYVVPAN